MKPYENEHGRHWGKVLYVEGMVNTFVSNNQ